MIISPIVLEWYDKNKSWDTSLVVVRCISMNEFMNKSRDAESVSDEDENLSWHYDRYINFPDDYKDLVMFEGNDVYIIEGQWDELRALSKVGLEGIRIK